MVDGQRRKGVKGRACKTWNGVDAKMEHARKDLDDVIR